jgi:hypothetical protein
MLLVAFAAAFFAFAAHIFRVVMPYLIVALLLWLIMKSDGRGHDT